MPFDNEIRTLRNAIPDAKLAQIEAAAIAKAAGLLAQEPANKEGYCDAVVRLVALRLVMDAEKVGL